MHTSYPAHLFRIQSEIEHSHLHMLEVLFVYKNVHLSEARAGQQQKLIIFASLYLDRLELKNAHTWIFIVYLACEELEWFDLF
jgi:hypothetical protein